MDKKKGDNTTIKCQYWRRAMAQMDAAGVDERYCRSGGDVG